MLLNLENLVVVIAYSILIGPEHSQKWSIRPLFSLVLPNLWIDIRHDFVGYSTLNTLILYSLPELRDQVSDALEFVIYSRFFKAVNNPLEIRRWNVDFFLLEFSNFRLGCLIIFDFEWPVFFNCILEFRVHWLSKFDVIWWDLLASRMVKFFVLQKSAWILQFNVSPVVRKFLIGIYCHGCLDFFWIYLQIFNLRHWWSSLILRGIRCSVRCDSIHNLVWNLKLIFGVIFEFLGHGDVAVTLTARIGCYHCWSVIFSLPMVRIRDKNVCVGEFLERANCDPFLLTITQ